MVKGFMDGLHDRQRVIKTMFSKSWHKEWDKMKMIMSCNNRQMVLEDELNKIMGSGIVKNVAEMANLQS